MNFFNHSLVSTALEKKELLIQKIWGDSQTQTLYRGKS